MKCIVFDTSTIISIVTNNLLYILKPLRQKYKGEFCLPTGVRQEIIDKPLTSRKFKLEAMQILAEVNQGTLRLDNEPEDEVREIVDLANSIFMLRGNYVHLMHWGEASVLVLAKKVKADAVAIDERTTRLMIEDPAQIARIFSQKMHAPLTINRENLEKFKEYVAGMTVLRSAEIGVIAYDLGLLDEYMRPGIRKIAAIKPKREVLEGLLWGLKLRGCSINTEEIEQILRLKGF